MGADVRSREIPICEGNYAAVVCMFLGTVVFRWAIVQASGIPIIASGALRAAPLLGVMVFITIYCAKRGLLTLSRVAKALVLMLLAMAYLPESNEAMVHLARAMPYADVALGTADEALGLDWIGYTRWFDAHPVAWNAVTFAYHSIWTQVLGTVLFLSSSRTPSRAYIFLAAHGISLTIVCIVVAAFPALGAYVHWDAVHAGLTHRDMGLQDHMSQTLEWLRSDRWGPAPAQICEGIVSFPSYHAVCSVTVAWATWNNRWLRLPSCLLNLAMIAGTPIQGAHYFVDVAAGIAVACASIVVAKRIVGSDRIAAATWAAYSAVRGTKNLVPALAERVSATSPL